MKSSNKRKDIVEGLVKAKEDYLKSIMAFKPVVTKFVEESELEDVEGFEVEEFFKKISFLNNEAILEPMLNDTGVCFGVEIEFIDSNNDKWEFEVPVEFLSE